VLTYTFTRLFPRLPEILRQSGFVVSIFFERGVKHHLPHCHIRWGDDEAVVALPTMRPIVGKSIPKAGRKLLAENVGLLVAQWGDLERQQQGTEKKKKKMMKKMKAGRQTISRIKKRDKRGRG